MHSSVLMIPGYVQNLISIRLLAVQLNRPEFRFLDLLMALVDTSSFWVAGYFKETQLPHIEVGQKANLTFMGYPNQPFEGMVRSVGWGVYVQDGSDNASTGLLPSISQTVDWVRLPQRFAGSIGFG
ncbi:MAG: HlyD family efflux transporter periplasmic adaptor subunit [Chthoniobacterales bacterium]